MNTFFHSRNAVYLLVLLSGMAALSWEVIWQVKATLALGISAWGTALILATTMGGMCAGALIAGHVLADKSLRRPIRLYGIIEIGIGIAGLCLTPLFQFIEKLDTYAYSEIPEAATLVHIAGIVIALCIPTLCMGATLPVFGLVARQFRTSIAVLYGLNTLGAAIGALCAAFILIPSLGLTHAAWLIASLNITAGLATFLFKIPEQEDIRNQDLHKIESADEFSLIKICAIIFATGFSTFLLEVAWFRSLTAAFRSTTSAFAIMLSAVLIGLGLGARLVPLLKKLNLPLGAVLAVSGILILLATPLVERFDMFTPTMVESPFLLEARWFVHTLTVVGIPMLLLGVALPWLLDSQQSTGRWGRFYALNALASIAGALSSAWIFLPLIGFARTAWIGGIIVLAAGLISAPRNQYRRLAAAGLVALIIAAVFESGVGRTRALGWLVLIYNDKLAPLHDENNPLKVLKSYEGPNATITAVQYTGNKSALIIDGFVAAYERPEQNRASVHYMPWMGHLPMLAHPDPRNALVICFGTGQTANAVRNENPERLDIVDVNPQVLKLAHYFADNQNVLADPRVHTTIMDGHAYIRRTNKIYDVITLEPMPPTFAGVNALYSQDFYRTARSKMSADGMIAQWLPFHLVNPYYSRAIAKTFQSIFPNSILWLDPVSETGILLGSKNPDIDLAGLWPGYARPGKGRDLTREQTQKAVMLKSQELEKYSRSGRIITDDNQLLAYGDAALQFYSLENDQEKNIKDLLTFAPSFTLPVNPPSSPSP